MSTLQASQKSIIAKDASGASLASSPPPAFCTLNEPPHQQGQISSCMFSRDELALGYPVASIQDDLSRLPLLF